MAHAAIDWLRMARGGPITTAVVRRAEMRTALDNLPWDSRRRITWVVAVRFGPPRGFSGTQQALPYPLRVGPMYQSVVHSHTLPIMSSRP